MAQVKIEDIVDHLSREFQGALEDAVRQVMPDAHCNSYALFHAFKQAVYSRCSIWEQVPDQYVKQ